MSNHDHIATLLYVLGEAADDLRGGDEGRAAERLRTMHGALWAAASAPDWETLALVLEPHVARADADDAWPYHAHLGALPDPKEDAPPPNLMFPFGKVY